jgi:titin
VTAGNAGAVVTWSVPVSDNGSAVTGYAVTPYAAGVARPVQTFPPTATTGSVTGLTNGLAYAFKVAAGNANGTGTFGAASTPALTIGAPTAPTTPSATPGNGTAVVAWHAPVSNNGSAVTRYLVVPYRNGVAQPLRSFAATPLTQTITGLANGSPYTFRIAAANARGTGISIATTAITVGAPIAPTAVHGTMGPNAGQATVRWTAPASNSGAAITGYVVIPYTGGTAGAAQMFASTATMEFVSGLTPGNYTFTVAATNSRGLGAASAPSSTVSVT